MLHIHLDFLFERFLAIRNNLEQLFYEYKIEFLSHRNVQSCAAVCFKFSRFLKGTTAVNCSPSCTNK